LSSTSSSKYPIAYLEIHVFSHATEDLEKVETAIRNTLPVGLVDELLFTKTNCVGHHGNPIVLIEAKLTNRVTLPSILEKMSSSLSPLDKEQLATEINQHVEKHNLYLRFDKQSAFLGSLKLGHDDPIRFKIQFKNKPSDEIISLCKQAGLLP
jgi:RNA binding exosome subunit